MIELAQLTTPAGDGRIGALRDIVAPFLIIFVIIYFLLIRPAHKRQKQVQEMLDQLKNGDRVITSGGLIGTVVGIDRNVVQLRIADKVKVDVTKSSIVGRPEGPAPSTTEA
jgi:preprotein translocase subunit YajC